MLLPMLNRLKLRPLLPTSNPKLLSKPLAKLATLLPKLTLRLKLRRATPLRLLPMPKAPSLKLKKLSLKWNSLSLKLPKLAPKLPIKLLKLLKPILKWPKLNRLWKLLSLLPKLSKTKMATLRKCPMKKPLLQLSRL